MMLVRLAWRNIWRNRRRTLIILTSIVVGVLAMVYVDSYANGFMDQLIRNQLGTHTAHLQIHRRGFNDDRTIGLYMDDWREAVGALGRNPNVQAFSGRDIVFGLISSASTSAGVVLVGVNPEEERRITTISTSLTSGVYLSGAEREIVLSKRLSETLAAGLGDRVVTMASTPDGTVGSEVFRIVGIYQSANSTFDKMHVYIPLASAQRMLQCGNRLAELAVVARTLDEVPALRDSLRVHLGPSFEVLSYHDLLPSLLLQRESMKQIMLVFSCIIAFALLFGIVNTMLMSIFERIREFGVLKAVGMSNARLFRMIVLEAVLIGLLGTAAGAALSVAIGIPLGRTGINLSSFSEGLSAYGAGAILYPHLTAFGVLSSVAIVFAFCVLAALYPAVRAMRLQPISAIRYV